jgi:hypothetical protein
MGHLHAAENNLEMDAEGGHESSGRAPMKAARPAM